MATHRNECACPTHEKDEEERARSMSEVRLLDQDFRQVKAQAAKEHMNVITLLYRHIQFVTKVHSKLFLLMKLHHQTLLDLTIGKYLP